MALRAKLVIIRRNLGTAPPMGNGRGTLTSAILLVTSGAVSADTAHTSNSANHLTAAAVVTGHCAAWNTADRAKRGLILKRVFAKDGVYNDPAPTYVMGPAALSNEIARFQRQHPGARFQCSIPQVHHNAMRVSWGLFGADGKLITEGMDFYQLAPNGQIHRVTGFFGPPPTINSRP